MCGFLVQFLRLVARQSSRLDAKSHRVWAASEITAIQVSLLQGALKGNHQVKENKVSNQFVLVQFCYVLPRIAHGPVGLGRGCGDELMWLLGWSQLQWWWAPPCPGSRERAFCKVCTGILHCQWTFLLLQLELEVTQSKCSIGHGKLLGDFNACDHVIISYISSKSLVLWSQSGYQRLKGSSVFISELIWGNKGHKVSFSD